MDPNINAKTGDAPIKKIGHTFSGAFGSAPDIKAKGAAGTMPTEQTFGGGGAKN